MVGERDPAVTEALSGARTSLIRRVRLEVESGTDKGQVFSSTGELLTVGTHASADVVLQDPAVSRFHCELALGEHAVVLRDLGSKNGTLVDGVPVIAAPLRDGASIDVGRSRLRVHIDAEGMALPTSGRKRFGGAVGRSAVMGRVFALLDRAAKSDSTVLIEGETGTGKELAAESIHEESARRTGPFVVVDCSAVPRELLESELFGHEKGAFTGASAPREGAFEAAAGGTVFLDEIGELSPELQPKLLRALERHEVKRVGSNKYTRVDLRVIAATNKNLREEVNQGRFRPDLYYRLAVIQVRLPPLRERTDDLPLLVENVLATLGASTKPEADIVRAPEFLADLAQHAWPGDVRELRNYVERCLALSEAVPLSVADGAPEAGASIDTTVPIRVARERAIQAFERKYVEAIMAEHGDNVTAAARAAGLARNHFYRLLWRYGLR